MEIQYSRFLSILVRITILYSMVVSSRVPAFCVSAVAHAFPCVCFGLSNARVSLPMFHLKVHCRKCPMQKRLNWKAHRVTSGTAYSCEVRSSVCWCRPGWELGSFSCCRPGWKPGILVLRTRLGFWSSRGVDQVGPGNFVLS